MKFNWKKTSVVIPCIGALVIMTAMVVVSQGPPGRGFRGGPGGPGGHGGPPDGLGPLARELNLTDDQKTQIKKITDSFAESTKSLHEQLRTLHESEPDAFTTTFDEAPVRAAAEARSKIEIELAVAHAKLMAQVGAVLTADQKAQLAAKRNEFGHRPPPPPPGE